MNNVIENLQRISVVSSIDQNMVYPLAVMLFSLMKNMSPAYTVEITIIENGLTESYKKILLDAVARFSNARISFFPADLSLFNSVYLGHLSTATYFRLLLPRVVDDSFETSIYLDADMIILDDVSKLWSIELGENLLGAVADSYGENSFNAGVLIYNLRKWRNENLSEKSIEFVNKNASILVYHDQQALNMLCSGKWLPLDMAWNVCKHHFSFAKIDIENYYYIFKPRIIHFSGYPKVWHHGFHPYMVEYKKYAEEIGWNIFEPVSFVERIMYQFSFRTILSIMRPLFVFRSWLEKRFLKPTRNLRGRMGIKKSQLFG
jgi:lipopolysaccharide biosynthesis glycosyltransferase